MSTDCYDFLSSTSIQCGLFICYESLPSPTVDVILLCSCLLHYLTPSTGFSTEELMRVPAGRRRKYHDDVTVIVIMLGNKQRTSTASTSF